MVSSSVPLCLYAHRRLGWWLDPGTYPILPLRFSGTWTALAVEAMLVQAMLMVVLYLAAVDWHNHCLETEKI